ncbi:MAG: ArsR/SmtB family transcription factor [Gemmatimonadales bacterium]
MASTLRIVATPTRQRILQLCWDQERPAGEIAAGCEVTFGAVSQHLKILHDHGLVRCRKSGRSRLYQAVPESLGPLAAILEAEWTAALTRLKTLAESAARRQPKR